MLLTRWETSHCVIKVHKVGQSVQPASILPTCWWTRAAFVLLNDPFYFGRPFFPSFLAVQFPYKVHSELTIAKWRQVVGCMDTSVAPRSLPLPGFVIDSEILILSNLTALPADPNLS